MRNKQRNRVAFKEHRRRATEKTDDVFFICFSGFCFVNFHFSRVDVEKCSRNFYNLFYKEINFHVSNLLLPPSPL